jgi:integrase
MTRFQSIFAEHLAKYVRLRRQLGLRFVQQEGMLCAFDQYVHERGHQGPLTEELARDFATAVPDASTTVPARRYLVVRHFADYLATFDSRTPRLDPKAIYRARRQPPPYVFTDEDLQRILVGATHFAQRHPVANRAFQAMVGLAACAGLRLREVVSLDLADVDLETGVLVVRHSKFDKDRLVPVHPTMLDVLRAYASVRGQTPRSIDEAAFFLNARGRRVRRDNVEYLFRQLVRRIDLRPSPRRPPTFHSLRHTFAVRRLVTWYRAGANVQALLPALATYMGHVHYTSTAYYLTATADLLDVAAGRLDVTEGALHVQDE